MALITHQSHANQRLSLISFTNIIDLCQNMDRTQSPNVFSNPYRKQGAMSFLVFNDLRFHDQCSKNGPNIFIVGMRLNKMRPKFNWTEPWA